MGAVQWLYLWCHETRTTSSSLYCFVPLLSVTTLYMTKSSWNFDETDIDSVLLITRFWFQILTCQSVCRILWVNSLHCLFFFLSPITDRAMCHDNNHNRCQNHYFLQVWRQIIAPKQRRETGESTMADSTTCVCWLLWSSQLRCLAGSSVALSAPRQDRHSDANFDFLCVEISCFQMLVNNFLYWNMSQVQKYGLWEVHYPNAWNSVAPERTFISTTRHLSVSIHRFLVFQHVPCPW